MPKDVSQPQVKKASAPAASKPASASKPPTASKASKSTIDDIFAAKPSSSSSTLPSVPSSSIAAAEPSKKKKKRKAATGDVDAADASSAKAAPAAVVSSAVQTVVDPSLGVGKKAETQSAGKLSAEEIASFRDSRGDGKSTGRTTEEGWKIYKEDALGIAPEESGGTPLCPFDCECCF